MVVRRPIRILHVLALTVTVAASYAWAWIRCRALPVEQRKERMEAVHRRNADRIYDTSVRLRGAFLKVGQFVGTRIDLVPPAYVESLARLQDEVPPLPWPTIEAQLRAELGRPVDEAFASFTPEPVAAASLGQVHEATSHDGARVAVKVQFPHMEEIVRGDLASLTTLAHAVHRIAPGWGLPGIADELATYIGRETDYLEEGRNAERFAEHFRGWGERLVIPGIHWELTTRHVLTMDFIEGTRITRDLEASRDGGLDGQDRIDAVCTTIVDSFCKQTLADGLFHADPHPGNFLVTPDGRLGLVDFGCVKELPDTMRLDYVRLARGIVERDDERMREQFLRLGFAAEPGAEQLLAELAFRYMGIFMADRANDFRNLDFDEIWRGMMGSFRSSPIAVPQDFVLLGRVFVALTGLTRQFDPDVSYFRILVPYLLVLLQESQQGEAGGGTGGGGPAAAQAPG